MNNKNRQKILRRAQRRRELDGDTGWPLVGFGAICVMAAAAFGLSSYLHSLPVLLPLMMLPIPLPLMGVELAALCFVIYNVLTLGRKIDRVPGYAPVIAGIIIALIGCLSGGYYAVSWKYRNVYQSSSMVDALVVFNSILAVVTVALWIRSMRYRTLERTVLCHIAMFVWFYSVAFPRLGESI